MIRTRSARFGLAFVAVAGLLGVGGTAAAQVPTSAPARTVVRTYDPWTHAGKLAPGVRVARTIRGYCWTTSIAEGTANAYRCMSGNYIYDPCFAPHAGAAGVSEVACAPAPWSKVVMMRLTRRLPANSGYRPTLWALVLAGGDRCVVGTGTNGEVDGVVMFFYCNHGLAGGPSMAHEPWTVRFATSYRATHLETKAVVIGWY